MYSTEEVISTVSLKKYQYKNRKSIVFAKKCPLHQCVYHETTITRRVSVVWCETNEESACINTAMGTFIKKILREMYKRSSSW